MIFSMPGKLGDALLQWPIAYQWAKNNDRPFRLWLDEQTCGPLKPLFEAQSCCEGVELKAGIKSHEMGGQPWDWDLKTEDHVEQEIVHLGMRAFPAKQITLQTLEWMPFKLDARALCREASLVVPIESANRVVLHGTFNSHHTGVPGFWKFLNRVRSELTEAEEIAFVGTPDERQRAQEVYPDFQAFDDESNFLTLARFVQGARAVIAAGSSVAALAGALKVPCIRVHDPIGDHPKVIWSNLGPGQLNETERELRRLWPGWKAQHLACKVEVA